MSDKLLDTDDIRFQLKRSLRRFAKTVVVVSCAFEGRRYAIVATAVSELSLDPPMMLACINRTSSIHTPMMQDIDFCLNVLNESQTEISQICGGQLKTDRFDHEDWKYSDLGVPYVDTAQANIFCRSELRIGKGTHTIFIGNVLEVRHHDGVSPLVYIDGRYTSAR